MNIKTKNRITEKCKEITDLGFVGRCNLVFLYPQGEGVSARRGHWTGDSRGNAERYRRVKFKG